METEDILAFILCGVYLAIVLGSSLWMYLDNKRKERKHGQES